MLVSKLYELVGNGTQPIIKFTEAITKYLPQSFDPFMMGKIIKATEEYGGIICLHVDIKGFEGHNKSVAVRDWRDEKGVPCLSWFETSFYPEDGIETIYIPDNMEAPLEIMEETAFQSGLNHIIQEMGTPETVEQFI